MKRALACALLLALGVAGLARAAEVPARPAPGIRYVYLIRHATYERDTSVTDDRAGNGIDALGHEQAKLTGARLAALPVTFSQFVSSDYLRAVQTADDIGKVLGRVAERDSLLEECTPNADIPAYMRHESADGIGLCESHLAAAWAKYMTPSPAGDTHDLLVAHGNVIRWFVSRALENDTRHWTHMEIANASLTVIAVRADGWARLVLFSDASHIPVAKQTWTGKGAGWSREGVGMR